MLIHDIVRLFFGAKLTLYGTTFYAGSVLVTSGLLAFGSWLLALGSWLLKIVRVKIQQRLQKLGLLDLIAPEHILSDRTAALRQAVAVVGNKGILSEVAV
jgi:hypothetical protein